MKHIIEGKAYVLGDDIDTDQIIPAEHLVYSLSDPEEKKNYGKFALSGVPTENAGLPDGGRAFVSEGKHASKLWSPSHMRASSTETRWMVDSSSLSRPKATSPTKPKPVMS